MRKVVGMGIVFLSGLVLTGCGTQLSQGYLVENDWQMAANQPGEPVAEDVPLNVLADFEEDVMRISFELNEEALVSAEEQLIAQEIAPAMEGLSYEVNYTLEDGVMVLEQSGEEITHNIRLDEEGNIWSDVVEPEGQEQIEEEILFLEKVVPAEEESAE